MTLQLRSQIAYSLTLHLRHDGGNVRLYTCTIYGGYHVGEIFQIEFCFRVSSNLSGKHLSVRNEIVRLYPVNVNRDPVFRTCPACRNWVHFLRNEAPDEMLYLPQKREMWTERYQHDSLCLLTVRFDWFHLSLIHI